MIRETVVEEVSKILHGPIGGPSEELEKNPLDFYTVGILFPRIIKVKEVTDPNPEEIEYDFPDEVGDTDDYNDKKDLHEKESVKVKRATQEIETNDDSGEFELTTKFRPSAAGLSILTKKNADLLLTVKFATYKKIQAEKSVIIQGKTEIKNISVFKQTEKEFVLNCKDGTFNLAEFKHSGEKNVLYVNLDYNATISIITRKYPLNEHLEIKTFTLINSVEVDNFKLQKKTEDCLYQPCIIMERKQGFEPFEDLTDLSLLSPEDLNLKLLYRHYKKYSLGHGISVNWEQSGSLVNKIFTQVLPQEKVNGVDLDPTIFKDKSVLFMKRLGGASIDEHYDWERVKGELIQFKELYDKWIKDEQTFIEKNLESLQDELLAQANENIKHCLNLSRRMHQGILLLMQNQEARKAFEDANRAMFMQRVMADFSKHRRYENRVQHDTSEFDDSLPDYSKIPFNASSQRIWKSGALFLEQDSEKKGSLARWRPFQLAFLLSQIEGIIDPLSLDRDTVDLIWFPTGGGKTEAYLGLTAFTIFYRRLLAKKVSADPDKGAGVTVLMRYTLRLLNKQQFERASIIICACELIRRKESYYYGQIRISNGIWMGRSMTPNNEKDQYEEYSEFIRRVNNKQEQNSFTNSPPILSCPCCGNRLIREIINENVKGRWGYFTAMNNRNRPKGRYLIACTNSHCEFYVTPKTLNTDSIKLLPIYEVDETIYQERPSLLFSTVDKFVQLAWKNEAFNLFNIDFQGGTLKRLYPSPNLIIQDELHLISSALGTIYGVYEIVIDKLCREDHGAIPKIIGATATVRNAEEQCKRLYGRGHFLQFPPPGTNADDSFYSKKIIGEDPKNRLYVGFMPSGVTTSTALIRLASVLLERIPTMAFPNKEIDKHYTVVVYFNALKELGRFRTFLTDDIVAYRKLLANHFKTFIKRFNNNSLCELSSVMTADDITKGLDKLEKTTLPTGLDFDNALVKKLHEKGIRTSTDLLGASGAVWNESFINENFFDEVGLKYTGDFLVDIGNFRKMADTIFKDKSQAIQIAPATNMISVGVDIPRLNTMIVGGQPKTTAEYIQASSRVGREDKGVVFTFLSPTKNRDRSHYEQFKAFHQAYYYFVESSSVTPYSVAALEKVLPTVLIALTRSLYLNGDNRAFLATETEYTQLVEEILDEIIQRGIKILGIKMSKEITETVQRIKMDFFSKLKKLVGHRKLAEYGDFMDRNQLTGRMQTKIKNQAAIYNAQSHFTENILKDHIPTMGTLRNVESSTTISIKS